MLMSGVVVAASAPVAVQAASINDLSTDATSVLPVSALGTLHHVVTYVYSRTSRFNQGPAQLGECVLKGLLGEFA